MIAETLSRIIIVILNVYRSVVSPFLPPSCRFVPSCSEYAVISIERHGVFKGGWLAAQRVLKCHPWGPSGYDPVPEGPEKE